MAAGAILAITCVVAGYFAVNAKADSEHGRPGTCATADEAGFASRDGFDQRHHTSAAVFAALADSAGWLNVCRTNDAVVVEKAQGVTGVKRISGVNRAQIHPQLQHWNGAAWVVVSDGPSVNTGDNRTLAVTTSVVDTAGATTGGWYRNNNRVLLRYSNNSLQFTEWQTPPIWTGDGPVNPAAPPA